MDPLKVCPGCLTSKSLSDFNYSANRTDGRQTYCRECEKSNRTKRLLDPKEKERVAERARIAYARRVDHDAFAVKLAMRKNTLWSKFKMTLDEYDALLESQGGMCANLKCKATSPGRTENWCVDHDHSCCSGRTKLCGNCNRGLLCHDCNLIIGYAHDNQEILLGAVDYLRQSPTPKRR